MTGQEQLAEWRRDQHDETVFAADVRLAVWLASLTPDTVTLDRAVHMQPAEIALMALPRGSAA